MGYDARPATIRNTYIPYSFANFVACENPEWISPNGAGAFYLYAEVVGWEDSQDTKVLLERFKAAAKTDKLISEVDVADAEEWVNNFRERYGESQLFYFTG